MWEEVNIKCLFVYLSNRNALLAKITGDCLKDINPVQSRTP
jgi:hypothetical protein